nr:hemagglutinin repeat-containing protein [Xanthomonas arboricola]
MDDARQSDGRLSTMQNMAAAANAYQSVKAAKSGTILSIEAGVGFATSESSFNSNSQTSLGSTITGGGNVSLKTTEGDLHIVQGNLKAGDTLSLDSARDLVLEAGQSVGSEQSKGSNAGFEVGVGAQTGVYAYVQASAGSHNSNAQSTTWENTQLAAQTGVYAYVQASAGSHNSNAQSTTWENTQLAGKNVVLTSKGDTALRGAVVTADRIDAAALQLVSHAVLGAVLAEVNGAPMTGGALAGAGGELAAKYLTQTLYGDDPRVMIHRHSAQVLVFRGDIDECSDGRRTDQALDGPTQVGAGAGDLQGKTTVALASRQFDLKPNEIEGESRKVSAGWRTRCGPNLKTCAGSTNASSRTCRKPTAKPCWNCAPGKSWQPWRARTRAEGTRCSGSFRSVGDRCANGPTGDRDLALGGQRDEPTRGHLPVPGLGRQGRLAEPGPGHQLPYPAIAGLAAFAHRQGQHPWPPWSRR